MHLVPVVYVNSDGLPMCYEVIQPVSSPSHLHNSPLPPLSSARTNGSYDYLHQRLRFLSWVCLPCVFGCLFFWMATNV